MEPKVTLLIRQLHGGTGPASIWRNDKSRTESLMCRFTNEGKMTVTFGEWPREQGGNWKVSDPRLVVLPERGASNSVRPIRLLPGHTYDTQITLSFPKARSGEKIPYEVTFVASPLKGQKEKPLMLKSKPLTLFVD